MVRNVYRPWRKAADGSKVQGRIFLGRFRLQDEGRITTVSLKTSDEQVAWKKLDEHIRQAELERAGIAIPKRLVESASMPLVDLVKQFADELRLDRQCDSMYCDNVEKQLDRLIRDTGWKVLRDVGADSFKAWRSTATHRHTGKRLKVKTLNAYLAHLNAFFKWLGNRATHNPVADVRPISRKGQDRPRRAFSDGDLNAVLAVAGKWRLPAVFMATTGIRADETATLKWADLFLDLAEPLVEVRASQSKNGKPARFPLFGGLADELRAFKPADASAGDLVFPQGVPSNDQWQEVLKLADVPEADALGRKLCVHSLRMTYCTMLHRWGLVDGRIMQLMRVSDRKLIDRTYLDPSQLESRLPEGQVPWCPSRSLLRSQALIFSGHNSAVQSASGGIEVIDGRVVATPENCIFIDIIEDQGEEFVRYWRDGKIWGTRIRT